MTTGQKLSPIPSANEPCPRVSEFQGLMTQTLRAERDDSNPDRKKTRAEHLPRVRATSVNSGRIRLDQSRTVGRVTHSPSRSRLSNRISNRQRRRLELPVTPFPFNRISNSNRLITAFLRRVSGFEGFRVCGFQALMIQTQPRRRLEGLLPRPAVRNPRLLIQSLFSVPLWLRGQSVFAGSGKRAHSSIRWYDSGVRASCISERNDDS